jgi:hypothetical protein
MRGGTTMKKRKSLTRDIIIQKLVDALEPLEYIYAFWEGGAAAFKRIDEWSDIDLYLVADDKKVDKTFLAVEKALKSLSPIKQKYEIQHPQRSSLFQAFYKLEDASEYIVIDLAVLTPASPDKFLEPEIHGDVVFYFNKPNEIKPPALDKDALVKKLKGRVERLKARFNMFNNFVQKEINRGNYLEAIDLYHALTLATLVEALRIKYNPVHHDFKMRYIHYELPSETIRKLKHLYFVEDEKDLQEKYRKTTNWIQEIMSEIDEKKMERIVRTS